MTTSKKLSILRNRSSPRNRCLWWNKTPQSLLDHHHLRCPDPIQSTFLRRQWKERHLVNSTTTTNLGSRNWKLKISSWKIDSKGRQAREMSVCHPSRVVMLRNRHLTSKRLSKMSMTLRWSQIRSLTFTRTRWSKRTKDLIRDDEARDARPIRFFRASKSNSWETLEIPWNESRLSRNHLGNPYSQEWATLSVEMTSRRWFKRSPLRLKQSNHQSSWPYPLNQQRLEWKRPRKKSTLFKASQCGKWFLKRSKNTPKSPNSDRKHNSSRFHRSNLAKNVIQRQCPWDLSVRDVFQIILADLAKTQVRPLDTWSWILEVRLPRQCRVWLKSIGRMRRGLVSDSVKSCSSLRLRWSQQLTRLLTSIRGSSLCRCFRTRFSNSRPRGIFKIISPFWDWSPLETPPRHRGDHGIILHISLCSKWFVNQKNLIKTNIIIAKTNSH